MFCVNKLKMLLFILDSDEELLRRAGSVVGRRANRSHLPLKSGKLDIVRMVDANIAEPSDSPISGTA